MWRKNRSGIFGVGISLLLLYSCHGDKHAQEGKGDIALRKKYAGLLGVTEKEIRNLPLYRFIDDWYGTPYKYAGKSKSGVDCSGFASILYDQVYKKKISGSASSIFGQCDAVNENKLEEGDLVFFKINGDKISHVGVFLQNKRFVHASTHKGVIISSLDEAYYHKYFYKGGKLK